MPAILDELSAHLQKVDEEPATPLDIDLLEKCTLYTSKREYHSSTWKDTRPLFLQLASLMPNLQQDPSPLTRFIVKLAAPYRFEDIKHVDFETGLDLAATPFHGMILSLLEKAAASNNDATALANRPGVLASIVRLWLCTKDTGVASQAADLLISLLRVSTDEQGPKPPNANTSYHGSAPIWKRLFKDRDIFTLYYKYTTLAKFSSPGGPSLSKRDKTIAQARLLEWLPRVGSLDWNTLITSHGSDVEREIGQFDGQDLLHYHLLRYASLKMVDTDDDILMHMTLINFFSDLITTVRTTSQSLSHSRQSLSLCSLKGQGTHDEIINFHTTDNPGVEHSFLASRTAHYIAQYASIYPDNFENSPESKTIRQFVHSKIRSCDPNDLNIVAAMPRSSLVPSTSSGLAWDDCILLDIPSVRTTPNALKTLATVFHGPPKEEIVYPEPEDITHTSNRITLEKTYARLLTSLYYKKHPSFFSDIITLADTIAIKDNALAALTLLGAIITSNWDSGTRPDKIPENDPLYTRLDQFPESGVALILDPSLSGGVLPYLIKPATTFSNLVGGKGDAENAAYQVAMAKFDVLQVLGERLEKEGGREDVLSIVRRRLAEGPWGVGGSAGSRIGTLEL